MAITLLDQCIQALFDRIDRTTDKVERQELIKIKNKLIALRKKQLLTELDQSSHRYLAITGHLEAITADMKATTDAIDAASQAAALLVRISALLAGV
ncbi:hypothetical protein [Rhizobium sp. S163]|uniref:hypothetical protein n=1 Tax=Rhizobium sp. S163 TaxID=3055039 RepID=UPI000DE1866B|nr:hypothetical protein [Rhizobium sp. S163]MDM9645024.1 hypothetical protein [Rhizobium sp. S163]